MTRPTLIGLLVLTLAPRLHPVWAQTGPESTPTLSLHHQPDSTAAVHRAFFKKALAAYPCREPRFKVLRTFGQLSAAEACTLTEWALAYVGEQLSSGHPVKNLTPMDTTGISAVASVEQWTVFDMSGGPTVYAWRVEFGRPSKPYDLGVLFHRDGPTTIEHITEKCCRH